MSTTALLIGFPDDERSRNLFSFDHAMAHRNLLSVMGPLDQWSSVPYFIDPTRYDARPATVWHLSHQQAHKDFTNYLPAYRTALDPGISIVQPLLDYSFKDSRSRSQWTFANHQEHLIAANAILPLPYGETVPWWALPPRWVGR